MSEKELSEGPLVTVLIPSYNHKQYVADSVNSVLKQTWKQVELIVIDDGSTDGSMELLSVLSSQYGFKYIAQKNKGLTATLNSVLDSANGKYFCMLSSDDMAMPDKLEKQVAFMEGRPDVGLCGGSAINIGADGEPLLKQKVLPYGELDFDDVYMGQKKGPTAPSMMARTEALKSVGGYDPDIRLEDMDMWLKLTDGGWKIICLEDVFAYYRVHDTNTYKNLEFMLDAQLRSWGKYSDHSGWTEMRNRLLISTFLKAAKRDKMLAIKLISKIQLRAYNAKVFRGLIRLGLSW